MWTRRGRRILAAVTVALALPMAALAAPAVWGVRAAGATSTVPNNIALVSQTPWVRTTAGMHLEVAIASRLPKADLGLDITLYSQATERSYFEETISGDTAGFTPIDPPTVLPLDTKGLVSPSGDASVDLPVSADGVPGKAQKAPKDGALLTFPCTDQCPGVYPLQVALEDLDDATTLDSFMTYLILAPDKASSPLRFSFILPIGSTPATTPTAKPDVPTADEKEVEHLDAALAVDPTASVSLALYPQFAKALISEASTKSRHGKPPDVKALAARQALAAARQLLSFRNVEAESETFTPVDAAGMAGSHLGSEMTTQFATGRSTLTELGAKVATQQYAASAPLGARGLALVQSNGVKRIEVPSDSAAPVPSSWDYPVWAPFRVSGSGVVADASDPYLEAHLESGTDPVLRANQLLADLAVLYFVEQPAGSRGVTLLAPLGWHPNAQLISTVFSGLSSSPIVSSVTLSQFFSQVPPGSAEEPQLSSRRLEAPAIPRDDDLSTSRVEAARAKLETLSSLLVDEPGRIEQLQDLVLLSETAGMSSAKRRAYLRAPANQLDGEAARVALPVGKTITITALSARVPISVYSKALTPLRVHLVVSSADFSFSRHVFSLLLEPRNNTNVIRVSARTSGVFPVKLAVTTVSGSYTLASGRIFIRSTAISGVAVGLTAGAAAVLVIWWARSAFRKRRGAHMRRGVIAKEPAAPPAPTPT